MIKFLLQSIRFNLVLVVVAGSLPIFLVIFLSGAERREREIDNASEATLRMAEYYAYTQEQELERIENILIALAKTPQVQAVDEEACNELFKAYRDANPNYANFAMMDPKGFAISSALPFKKPKDLSNRKEVIAAQQTGTFAIGEHSVGRVSKKHILPFAYPVYNEKGDLISILIAALLLKEYDEIFQEANLPPGSFVGLVDHAGKRLYRYPVMGRKLGEQLPGHIWNNVKSFDRSGMFSEASSTGERYVFAVSRISNRHSDSPFLNIVVGIPEKLLLDRADRVTFQYIMWGVLFLALSITLALLIGHYAIHKRLRRLVGVAQRLGAGDLEARSGLTNYSGTIGKLNAAFDSMADALERHVAKLEQAFREAEDANAAKSVFLANMSHEIRTPLNGLMGMLQLVTRAPLDQDQERYINLALRSSRRLTRLLSDILDISRVEAGKMDAIMEAFDFKDTMEGLFLLFSPSASEKDLDFNVHIDPAIPDMLIGDSPRLQQLLSNLIGNAIKFTIKGKVNVEAQALTPIRPGEYRVLFCVEDTGIGIADHDLEPLFTPFSQVEGKYKRRFQGAGLGLTISSKLVELMNGSMVVSSEEGVGTSVYFCLHFERAETVPEVHAPSELHETPVTGLAALLAEDDESSGIVIRRLLEELGHTVTVVPDGKQVLELLRNEAFDFVLMDVQMPIMDGLEATQAIRLGEAGAENRNIPIIAMTAYAMRGDRETFLTSGMNDYVPKPVEFDILERTLNQVLRSGDFTSTP